MRRHFLIDTSILLLGLPQGTDATLPFFNSHSPRFNNRIGIGIGWLHRSESESQNHVDLRDQDGYDLYKRGFGKIARGGHQLNTDGDGDGDDDSDGDSDGYSDGYSYVEHDEKDGDENTDTGESRDNAKRRSSRKRSKTKSRSKASQQNIEPHDDGDDDDDDDGIAEMYAKSEEEESDVENVRFEYDNWSEDEDENEVEIIPFDEEIEIIPFDDDVGDDLEGIKNAPSDDEIKIIPFDDDVSVGEKQEDEVGENQEEDENLPLEEGIEIIPFDDDVGEDQEEDCNIPFDDDDDGDGVISGHEESREDVQIIPFDNDDDDSDNEDISSNDDKNDDDHDDVDDGIPFVDDNSFYDNQEIVISVEDLDNTGPHIDQEEYGAIVTDDGTSSVSEVEDTVSVTNEDRGIDIQVLQHGNPAVDDSVDISTNLGKNNIESDVSNSQEDINDDVLSVQEEHGFNSASESSDLFRRIWGFLTKWDNDDELRSEDDQSKKLRSKMHGRARDYVSELLEFERYCFLALAQNLPLPKSAPHPKKVLYYIAPKLHAILKAPDIALGITSAGPEDVGAAATAIGVIAALVDVYEEFEKNMEFVCEGNTKHGFDGERVRKDILKDRRFGQLLECASCGVDVRRRIKEYNGRIKCHHDDCTGKATGHEAETAEKEDLAEIDQDDNIKDAISETISAPDIARLVLGITALGLDREKVISGYNATEYIASLGMRADDLLSCDFQNTLMSGSNEKKVLLSRDIVDSTSSFTAAAVFFDAKLEFMLTNWLELLAKDLTLPSSEVVPEEVIPIIEDTKMDDIVDRLAMSEDKAQNTTAQATLSNTTVSEDGAIVATERLLNYVSSSDKMIVLKSVTVNQAMYDADSGNATLILFKSAVTDMLNDVNFAETNKPDEYIEADYVDETILISSHLDDKDEGKLLSSAEDFIFEPSSCLGSVKMIHTERPTSGLLRSPAIFKLNIALFTVEASKGLLHSKIPLGAMTVPLMFHRLFEDSAYEESIEASDQLHSNDILAQEDSEEVSLDFVTSMQDICIIVRVASDLFESEAALSILESSLVLMEAMGYGELQLMDNFDIVNFIHGSAKILTNSRLSRTSATKLSLFLSCSLQRNFATMTTDDLFRLLWSIATISSTQPFSCIDDMVEDATIQDLIEHGLRRMKNEINSASLIHISTLPWIYAECYSPLDGKSSLDHFEDYELLGKCIATASSMMDTMGDIKDRSTICKLAYAISVLELENDSFVTRALSDFRQSASQYESVDTLDLVRLVYAIANSKVSNQLAGYEDLIITRFNKEAATMTPYTFAMMIWSLGQIFEHGNTLHELELPLYTRGQLSGLTPVMSSRMVRGITSFFDATCLRTNTRLQLMLKNLLLYMQHTLAMLDTSELLSVGQSIAILDAMNEEIAFVNMEEGDENDSEEIIEPDEYDSIDDEDEENVISSLFPSSNQRDINSLCKKVLTGIIDQTRSKLQAFSAGDLMKIMNTFAKSNLPIGALRDDIRLETERRKSLVKARLRDELKTGGSSSSDREDTLDVDGDLTYKSKIESFFRGRSRPKKQKSPIVKKSQTINKEIREIQRLLQLTRGPNELHNSLIQEVQNVAYELGHCQKDATPPLGQQPPPFQQRNRKSLIYPR